MRFHKLIPLRFYQYCQYASTESSPSLLNTVDITLFHGYWKGIEWKKKVIRLHDSA